MTLCSMQGFDITFMRYCIFYNYQTSSSKILGETIIEPEYSTDWGVKETHSDLNVIFSTPR
jgi:hypothetical protein